MDIFTVRAHATDHRNLLPLLGSSEREEEVSTQLHSITHRNIRMLGASVSFHVRGGSLVLRNVMSHDEK
jgi:hypothetical protein